MTPSSASHEPDRARNRRAPHDADLVHAALVALYAGLFDDGITVAATPGVGLLNPSFRGDDPASRRFAQLEVE